MKSKFIYKNNLRMLVIGALILLQPQFIAAQSVEILDAKLQKSFFINKEFPGILHPSQQSKISFQIPGRVASVNVDIGDVVTQNQILAKLDDSEISAQLKQAKARFNLSKQILKRIKDLKIDGHVSDQQLDEANSEFLTAQSQLEYFQVKLDQTKLEAPYDGLIQGRFLDPGSVINGGAQILEIIDSRFVEAHVTLPMEYISKVELGQIFKFKVSNKIYDAILKRIAPMSSSGSNSKLAIFQFDRFITPGVVAKLQLQFEEQAAGVWVPLKSLSQSDQGLWSLYTLKSNVVTKDLVEIIYFDDNYAYVNGTISNGDKIILGGASKVVQGMVLDSK